MGEWNTNLLSKDFPIDNDIDDEVGLWREGVKDKSTKDGEWAPMGVKGLSYW